MPWMGGLTSDDKTEQFVYRYVTGNYFYGLVTAQSGADCDKKEEERQIRYTTRRLFCETSCPRRMCWNAS
jgi:hypothetical protein